MLYSPRARKTDSKQREFHARLRVARFDVAMLAGALVWCAPAAWCVETEQDSGSRATEYFGNGAEINVIVHDGTGNPISATAMVRLYRDGNIPSGQGATSHGRVRFVVTNLGEFTVVVEPPGQPALQKDVSVHSAGERQVDVYLPPASNGVTSATGATAPPGAGSVAKVILAPKAQEAFDKGLRALSTDKMRDAEKYVGEAARLAPEDRLLVETDAPYLAPAPKRGKRNEPAFLVETVRRLGPVEVLPEKTSEANRGATGPRGGLRSRR